jgi:hypothetical protein
MFFTGVIFFVSFILGKNFRFLDRFFYRLCPYMTSLEQFQYPSYIRIMYAYFGNNGLQSFLIIKNTD